jgi:hypothetical protein
MATPPGSQDDHPPGGYGAASLAFLDEEDDGGGRYQVYVGRCLCVLRLCVLCRAVVSCVCVWEMTAGRSIDGTGIGPTAAMMMMMMMMNGPFDRSIDWLDRYRAGPL